MSQSDFSAVFLTEELGLAFVSFVLATEFMAFAYNAIHHCCHTANASRPSGSPRLMELAPSLRMKFSARFVGIDPMKGNEYDGSNAPLLDCTIETVSWERMREIRQNTHYFSGSVIFDSCYVVCTSAPHLSLTAVWAMSTAQCGLFRWASTSSRSLRHVLS
jgi:hypothetical protein